MKKSKLFFMSLLSLSLFLVTIIPTRALESSDNTNVNDEFVQFIDDMFLNQSKAKVWNRNGEDVTASFFADVENYYNNKDYQSIRVYAHDCVDEMCIQENKVSMKDARSPFVTQTVSNRLTKIINEKQASGEIAYTITGTYVWDRATYKITSASDPIIDVPYVNLRGAYWKHEIYSITTNKQIASDKYSVKFSGVFKMRARFEYTVDDIFTVDLGAFSNEVTGYPNDDYI